MLEEHNWCFGLQAEAAREKTNRLKDMVNRRYLSVGTSAVGSYSSSARQSSASSVTSEVKLIHQVIKIY